jgi:hypothetical protein
MQTRVPAHEKKTFVIRPAGMLTGHYTVGLTVQSFTPDLYAELEWCGSRRRIFLPGRAGYATSLKMPGNLTESDVFVLSAVSPLRLGVSLQPYKQGETTEDLIIAEAEPGAAIEYACGDPMPAVARSFEDPLVIGLFPVPARREVPIGHIQALRADPDGAVLQLTVRREAQAKPDRMLSVTVDVGEMRRLCILPVKVSEVAAVFRLQPESGTEEWPLTMRSELPVQWTGVVLRPWGSPCLPGFSWVE